jgi:hypothetical protein
MRFSLIFLCLFVVHVWLCSIIIESKGELDSRYANQSAVVGKMLRLNSMEFKSITADNVLLKAIFYIGDQLDKSSNSTDADWDYFASLAKSSAELDPYFFDTYYFSSSLLAWNAEMPQKAAEMLKLGVKHRPNDYLLLFNLGFIHYYFLNDKNTAADYIQRAAQIKKAPVFYASLGSRLGYDSGSHETTADFLLSMINQTLNEDIKKIYEKRLYAILGAIELEKALKAYQSHTGENAKSLDVLVDSGIIPHLPVDPYGGVYYIDSQGKVQSTSNFVENKKAAE